MGNKGITQAITSRVKRNRKYNKPVISQKIQMYFPLQASLLNYMNENLKTHHTVQRLLKSLFKLRQLCK